MRRCYRIRIYYRTPRGDHRCHVDTEVWAAKGDLENAAERVVDRLREKFPNWTIEYTGRSKWLKGRIEEVTA